MVIYHASTMYHLLSCIVHRLAYNPNDEAELLLLEHIRPLNERDEFFKKLESFNFFDRVRKVPTQSMKLSKGLALDENSSEKDIKTVVNNVSRSFANWFNEDITQYREIYVCSDISPFGVYLNNMNIPYNYMEDASGMLSEGERYLSITKGNNKTNFIVNQYLGCSGRSENVKARLGDMKHQSKDFHDEKAVDFSIYDSIKNIIPDRIDDLLGFFGSKNGRADVKENSCLLLTQDLNTLKIKDLDLQELTLTTLVDYIAPYYQLIVKPHPKDRWQNYRRIFPDSVILERAEPSELLPFELKRRVKIALTASSTSVRGVDAFAEKSYSFTTEIESNREVIDTMYIIAEVLKELGIKSGVTVKNMNETQMSAFLDNADIKQDGDNILIDGAVNSESAENTEKCGLVILPFDENKNGDFIIKAEFLPSKHSLMKHKTVKIPVVCNDALLKDKISRIEFKRNLKYTKAEIITTVLPYNEENIL